MSTQPQGSLYANLMNGHRSPVSTSGSNSRVSNGSSFEMLQSGTRTPAEMSFLNFPLGGPMSFSEITAEQALERVQELLKENNSLREYLKENNAVISNKYQEIAEWKERIKKYHKNNQEKCEEAKNVILNLRSENESLKKQLQETKNQAFHSLNDKIHQLEKQKNDLEEELSKRGDPRAAFDKTEAFVKVEDGTVIQEKQQLSSEVSELQARLKEFHENNEQLIKDLQNLQKVKDTIHTENTDLTNQNIELSQKLQNVLSDCKAAKAENRQLKQQLSQNDNSMGNTAQGYEKDQLQRSGEDPKQITQLQEMVKKLQIEIHDKNRRLEDYRTRQEQELTQLSQKHQMELMEKLQNAKEEQSSDIRSLQAQVLSLINEVTESQNKCEAATATIDQRNARLESNGISELEMIGRRKQEELNKVLQDINNLKSALANYEAALNSERRDHQNSKKQMAELRTSFNQMVADYKNLLTDYENLKKKQSGVSEPEKQKLLNKIGVLTAQVIAAEEAVKYRDEEVKEVKEALRYREQEIKTLKDDNRKLHEEVDSTIPVLKAQGDIWQADFHAEREAREKMHHEKEVLTQEMNQLQIQNQQLLDELESLSKGQFLEIQKRHAQPQNLYTNQLKSRLYVTNPPIVYPQQIPSPERGTERHLQYPQQSSPRQHEENSSQAAGQLPEEDILNCPKCNQVCPDLDSLQIHVLDCIEN